MPHKSHITIVTETVGLHRTQVLLEEWQYRLLESRAARQGTSVAALIRGMVEDALKPKRGKSGLDSIIGLGSSGKSGRDHDEELYG